MTSAAARVLNGDFVGGAILCPGPGHSARDRSLKVWLGADGQPRVHSFAGDDWRDCLDHVRERLGLEPFAPGKQEPHRKRQERDRKAAADRLDDEARARAKAAFMRDLARRIWREAGSCFGTLAQDYLRSRKIELDDDLTPRVLRFHPRCPFGPKAQAEFHPALLAAYTPIQIAVDDDNPIGLHRIKLTNNAGKIGKGMSLGPVGGCVIRLWPDEAVEQGLVIGEGIETVLATATCIEHRGTLLQPAWAAGCSGNLENFPVLSGIECLTILVDHDLSGTGQRAGEICGHRWRNAGRQVIRLVPLKPDSDFADIALEVTG